jgi:pimeloyl-ACP methyl ester carboxylesterase
MKAEKKLEEISYFVDVEERKHQLHLKRFYTDANGPTVFMVHGSIENGRIFYSKSQKGLAPFLAKNGFDVFVVDLRGRGESKPKIDKSADWGLQETLWTDFPALIDKMVALKGTNKMNWVAHSWGGVLFLAYYAKKYSDLNINSMVFLGTKRRISVLSIEKLYKINFGWHAFSKYIINKHGFLDAKRYKMGSDSESKRSHYETDKWVVNKKWLDWKDGFDYSAALKKIELPPILSLTGQKDRVLGHPADVKLLLKETGMQKNSVFKVLSKKNGNLHDYDHINIATHPDAEKDHFVEILKFLGDNN